MAMINGSAGNDTLNGTDFDDTIYGLAGSDSINGNAGNDSLYGDAGNDTLDGGTGIDVMTGGSGADIYVVDNVGDVVIEEPAAPVAGVLRVSTDAAGVQGNYDSGRASLSADGRYVAFESYATNLAANDTNGTTDIFVKDLQTGTVTLFSTDAAGVQGNGYNRNASLSADGRYVVFDSYSSNLVAGDTIGTFDVFVKDAKTGAVTLVSTDAAGVQGNAYSVGASISADGRYVAFESLASNLVAGDNNNFPDVFVKDIQSGAIARVSTNAAGVQGNGWSVGARLSADGQYVVFESTANNLVAGDTNDTNDIFVKDLQTGAVTRVSTDAAGVQGNGPSYNASLSADGRYVVFESDASNLVTGDTTSMRDIFVKDLQTGAVTRVSTDAFGVEGNYHSYNASISADGRYVVFESDASNLVTGDTRSMRDIFVKDLQTGAIQRVSTDAAGVEGIGGPSYYASFSADGRYVVFSSGASNLVAGDTNGAADVFRVPNPFFSSAGDRDTVHFAAGVAGTHTLAANVEDGVITGTVAGLNLTGNALDNRLTGNASTNVLSGGDGNDTLNPGGISATGNDTLDGGGGTDTADFSGAASAIWVGLGYAGLEAWTRDTTNLASGTWRTFADLINIENVTGTQYADYLAGDGGNNVLNPGGIPATGNDTLDGGAGTDTADFSGAASAIWVNLGYAGLEAWTRDTTNLASGTWRTFADLINIENVSGTQYADYLAGDGGNNVLNPGGIPATGNDTLDGGAGTDTADFSGAASAIWVNLGYAGLEAWTRDTTNLAAGTWRTFADLINIENVSGTQYGDYLAGDGAANALLGGDGNDTLNPGGISATGNDTLDGGAGTDTADFSGAASAIWVGLGYAGLEAWTRDTTNLASGTWRTFADLINIENVSGTQYADYLAGDGGNNVLNPGGIPATGNDTLDGGAGTDTADFSGAASAIWVGLGYAGLEAWTRDTTNLASGTWRTFADLINIENVSGTQYADYLAGDGGANVLSGGLGNDTLDGGAGNDLLTGGLGADTFGFGNTALNASTNVDSILDFQAGSDSIQLENAVFTKLSATGTLSAANFRASAGGTAADANDYILYDTDSGALYYDADGSGNGAAVQFATVVIVGTTPLSAADFIVT